jgi:hypothetical protein
VNPSSLVARIFKEKYYKSGSFLEAQVGHHPSYAWQCICQAREMLEMGLGWRVGNGLNIRIWGDAWLPTPFPRILSSFTAPLNSDDKVAALLNPASRDWNYELIRRVFDPGEMARICSVIVSPLGQADWLVWRVSANGNFSVKSAYNLAIAQRLQEKGECSLEAAGRTIWKEIWKLSVPQVVRHFCWKVYNNLLATKVNLAAKKIIQSSDCPICLREPETIVHCLWSCPLPVAIWQEASKRLQKLALMVRDGRELLSFFIEKLDENEVVEAVMVVARMIWLRRNSYVFQNVFSSPFRVVELAKETLRILLQHNSFLHAPSHPR